MAAMTEKNLLNVDWSKIPAPTDDGAAKHLTGATVPAVALAATDGTMVTLAALRGRIVVFAYPRTGEPGKASLVDGWDLIPGARGCTPQTCSFRDLFADLKRAGAQGVFGLSTQTTAYQKEAAERLYLPFALLSDSDYRLIEALRLPTFEFAGMRLLKRRTMVISDHRVEHVFYPVFPPDRSAPDVADWLRSRTSGTVSISGLLRMSGGGIP